MDVEVHSTICLAGSVHGQALLPVAISRRREHCALLSPARLYAVARFANAAGLRDVPTELYGTSSPAELRLAKMALNAPLLAFFTLQAGYLVEKAFGGQMLFPEVSKTRGSTGK